MKTLRTPLFALVLLLAFACKDDGTATTAVANDEAAEMTATSISFNSGGMTSAIDDATVTTKANGSARTNACGYSESIDAAKSNVAGASITYAFNYHYDYALTCTTAVPTTMTANMSYTGSLDAPRMSAQSTGTGALSVKTLDTSFNYFTINGSYNRSGTFVSKVRNTNTSNSTVTFVLTDVTVDKTSRMITGGTAAVNITGSVTGKGDFSYSGSLVFKGSKQGELDINGTKYSVNLETGDVTSL
jgi:hypothetical protein